MSIRCYSGCVSCTGGWDRAFSSTSLWVNSLLTGGSCPFIVVTVSCASNSGVVTLSFTIGSSNEASPRIWSCYAN